jgi:tetratricopeptide (TPR) repeat protein
VLALGLLSLTIGLCQDEEFASTFRKGTEALRAGNLEVAAGAFARCTVLQPTFAEAWLNLGLARFQQNDLDSAIPALEKSLQLKPKIRGPNLFLGIAYYRRNDYAAAAAALERETQADPGNADALMWLGIVRLAAGSSVDAVAILEKAAHMRPKDVDVLYHLGRAYMVRSKETYERMYVADPKSWRVHQVLAQSFADADRLDDAVKECQEAIRLKPNEPGLHQQLGDIYDRQNNLEMADAEYRNELKIDPHNAAVMYSLAVVSIERSKPSDAVGLLTEALRQAPGSVEAHYQLGRAEAQLSHNDSAAVNFAAVVANPQRVDAEMLRQSYYQLAQLYRRLHRPEESRAALDSFVRLKQQADTEQSHKLEDKLRKSVQAQQQ